MPKVNARFIIESNLSIEELIEELRLDDLIFNNEYEIIEHKGNSITIDTHIDIYNITNVPDYVDYFKSIKHKFDNYHVYFSAHDCEYYTENDQVDEDDKINITINYSVSFDFNIDDDLDAVEITFDDIYIEGDTEFVKNADSINTVVIYGIREDLDDRLLKEIKIMYPIKTKYFKYSADKLILTKYESTMKSKNILIGYDKDTVKQLIDELTTILNQID